MLFLAILALNSHWGICITIACCFWIYSSCKIGKKHIDNASFFFFFFFFLFYNIGPESTKILSLWPHPLCSFLMKLIQLWKPLKLLFLVPTYAKRGQHGSFPAFSISLFYHNITLWLSYESFSFLCDFFFKKGSSPANKAVISGS